MIRNIPTHVEEYIKNKYVYDLDSGLLYRKNRFQQLKLVGTKDKDGYLVVSIKRWSFFVHRIIWFLMTSQWVLEIDHDNRIRDDNRWTNLKNSTNWNNAQNRAIGDNHSSGIIGITFQNGLWIVRTRGIYIGAYKTKEEAIKEREFSKTYILKPELGSL